MDVFIRPVPEAALRLNPNIPEEAVDRALEGGDLVERIVAVGRHDGSGSGCFHLPGGDVAGGIINVVPGTFNHGGAGKRGKNERG